MSKFILRTFLPDGFYDFVGCEITRPATRLFFHRHPNGINGLHPRCRQCRFPAKPPKPLPKIRYCSACKKPFPATTEYFHARSDRKSGIKSECKSCGDLRQRNHYASTIEEAHQEQKRYRDTDPERTKNRLREYRVEHPEKYLTYNRNRRARKMAAPGTHTAQDIQAQFKRQKGKCYWCGDKLDKYEVDHVVPLTRGGSNDPSKLVIACKPCNNSRHNKLPHEWPQGGRLL